MTVIGILFMGIVATALFDLWCRGVARALSAPMPAWALPGRWFAHVARGRLRHDSIAAADPVKHETAIGWAGHYSVGILFAAVTVIWAGPGWLSAPTLGKPLFVGVVTVLLGWLVMSPCMGNGIAGSRTPTPTRLRIQQLVAHVVFGLALWGAALVFSTLI